MKIRKQDEKWTWALVSIADHYLLQRRTRLSPMDRLLNDLSSFGFGSPAASKTAIAPCRPIVNFAVNWRSTFNNDVMIMIKKLKTRSEPGHSSVLQIIFSSRAGHVSPTWFGCWMTSRVLVLVPPPQAKLHSLHADQSSTLQLTGNVKLWWHIQEWIFAMMATMIIVIIFKSLWIVVLWWFDGWFWSWDMAW